MVEAREHLPSTPKAFGHELNRLRESAGVTIDDLVDETKVTRRVFEALEEGRFERLPERVFSRNFVRQYATFVGADVGQVLESFDHAYEVFVASSGSHAALPLYAAPPQTPIRWQFWIPIGLAGAVLAIIGIMMMRSGTPSDDLVPDPRRSAAVAPSPTNFPSVLVSSPTPMDLPEAAVGEATEDDSLVSVRIAVAAGSECWVHYRDREGQVGQRLLRSGDSVTLDLAWPAHLSIGNAGAVAVQIGDRAYSELGRLGQVVHCEINGGELKVLGT